jgi:hypothetical protein
MDKAGLLVHEGVYRVMREKFGEGNSFRARKIVGLLFSDLVPKEMENRIRSVMGNTVNEPGGPVSNDGFFLKLANGSIDTALHKADAGYGDDVGTGNFTSACQIPNGARGTDADISCVLEVGELDVAFNSLDIQYNVPANACSYVRIKPYSFWSFEPGEGQIYASYDLYSDGTVVDRANTVNGVPTCIYDHTQEEGPNCCEGNYNLNVVQFATDGTFSSVARSTGSWGGKAANCLAGPAMMTQTLTPSGYPRNTVYDVKSTGVNSTYTIPSMSNFRSNVNVANFYNPSDHYDGRPPSFMPFGSIYKPQETYEWECLNGAGNRLSRIRLMIREWNTTSPVEGGDPDVGGADDDFPDQGNNDRLDWRDFEDHFPGAEL